MVIDSSPTSRASTTDLSATAARSSRRRGPLRYLITILVLFIVTLMAVHLVAVYMASGDNYTSADLTKGEGQFPVQSATALTLTYQPDGYHVAVNSVALQTVVQRAPLRHTASASVEVTVRADMVPPGAQFGPVLQTTDRGGFAFTLDPDGTAWLIRLPVGSGALQEADVLASAPGPPLRTGDLRTLELVYREPDPGFGQTLYQLFGYVDGREVFRLPDPLYSSDTRFTGAGLAASGQNGEWTAKSFVCNGF